MIKRLREENEKKDQPRIIKEQRKNFWKLN